MRKSKTVRLVKPAYRLVHETTGVEIKVGDKMKDFRGDTHVVQGFREPLHAASTGRVYTDHGEFFPSVIDAKIVLA